MNALMCCIDARPSIAPAAEAQIQAALAQVLQPLVIARESQLRRRDANDAADSATIVERATSAGVIDTAVQFPGMAVDGNDASAASNTVTTEAVPSLLPRPTQEGDLTPSSDPQASPASLTTLTEEKTYPSKRARQKAVNFARAERATAALRARGIPCGSHELSLRSGRKVAIPDNESPERFQPSLLLDKRAAIDNRPAICQALVVGINAVTSLIQDDVEDGRRQLLGLPARESVKKDKSDLRIFVPAPNKSTRKQRAELRMKLHPAERQLKRKRAQARDAASRKRPRRDEESGDEITYKYDSSKGPVPPLRNVPLHDAVLLHTLNDYTAELAEHAAEVFPATPAIKSSRLSKNGIAVLEAAARKLISIVDGSLADEHEAAEPISTSNGGIAQDAASPSMPTGFQAGHVSERGLPCTEPPSLPTEKTGFVSLPTQELKLILSMYSPFSPRSEDYTANYISPIRSTLMFLLAQFDREWIAAVSAAEAVDIANTANRKWREMYATSSAKFNRAESLEWQRNQDRVNRKEVETAAAKGAVSSDGGMIPPLRPSCARLVFVCTGDINPLAIVEHILTAVAARNATNATLRQLATTASHSSANAPAESSGAQCEVPPGASALEDVYLVPLGKGAEKRLADLLGLRRAAVLAITVGSLFLYANLSAQTCNRPQDTDASHFATLLKLVKARVNPISADWLRPATNILAKSAQTPTRSPPVPMQPYITTHIKHFQTTVPVDAKAVRKERKEVNKKNKNRVKSQDDLKSSQSSLLHSTQVD